MWFHRVSFYWTWSWVIETFLQVSTSRRFIWGPLVNNANLPFYLVQKFLRRLNWFLYLFFLNNFRVMVLSFNALILLFPLNSWLLRRFLLNYWGKRDRYKGLLLALESFWSSQVWYRFVQHIIIVLLLLQLLHVPCLSRFPLLSLLQGKLLRTLPLVK